MHVNVFHHHRRPWPMPKNHMDRRVCPTCKVTVHGSEAQRDHYKRHLDEFAYRARVNELLGELMKRTGMTEEAFPGDWEWGAAVEADDTQAVGE